MNDRLPDDTPVRDLDDLSVRTKNCLRNFGRDGVDFPIRTVGEARCVSDAELLRMPNFGRKSLKELRAVVPYEPESAVSLDALANAVAAVGGEIARIGRTLQGMEASLRAIARKHGYPS